MCTKYGNNKKNTLAAFGHKWACARGFIRARELEREPWRQRTPRIKHFSWHGGWFCFGPLKSPCTRRQTDTGRERERQTQREKESGQIHGAMTHRSARLLQWCSIDSFIRSEAAAQDTLLLPWTLSAVSSCGYRLFCTAPAAFWRSYRESRNRSSSAGVWRRTTRTACASVHLRPVRAPW